MPDFGFSTLYTNVKHKFLKVIYGEIEFHFKGRGKANRLFFVINKELNGLKKLNLILKLIFFIFLKKSSLNKAVKYLIENCCFKFGEKNL